MKPVSGVRVKNPRCWEVCLPGKQEEEGKSISEKSEKDDMSNWVMEDFFLTDTAYHLLSLVKISLDMFQGFQCW